jgi:hypothetical protein
MSNCTRSALEWRLKSVPAFTEDVNDVNGDKAKISIFRCEFPPSHFQRRHRAATRAWSLWDSRSKRHRDGNCTSPVISYRSHVAPLVMHKIQIWVDPSGVHQLPEWISFSVWGGHRPHESARLSSSPQLSSTKFSPCTLPVPEAMVSFRERTSSLWDVDASATALAMITRSVVTGASSKALSISFRALVLIPPFCTWMSKASARPNSY